MFSRNAEGQKIVVFFAEYLILKNCFVQPQTDQIIENPLRRKYLGAIIRTITIKQPLSRIKTETTFFRNPPNNTHYPQALRSSIHVYNPLEFDL